MNFGDIIYNFSAEPTNYWSVPEKGIFLIHGNLHELLGVFLVVKESHSTFILCRRIAELSLIYSQPQIM